MEYWFSLGGVQHEVGQVHVGPAMEIQYRNFFVKNLPDDLPIIGGAPGWENVTLATGHFRNGIMLAPITGDLVAKLIVENELDPLLKPLNPSRFGSSAT